ncbi:carboxypeptidase-like regulatory domain-containing protein [Tellurirhabdus rosea]|uniref:carboxypeptidase-like regulatory domain-containing protein n=1 Tax=Tellurirhabdus rosea TaxID=2674997 RepID=UPI00225080A9|nr:carboxypeptidase-like regulatory domain-containing protein [Tellurirhabdus rosea]
MVRFMKRFVFLLFLLGLPGLSFAQRTIEGRAVDAVTRKPLEFANVFVSNTTRGQNTDEKGHFKLTGVPSGAVDLVVTYLGYETFSLKINADTLARPLLILLTPKASELQAVTIRRLRNGFQDYFPLFRKNFIGETAFSNDCRLLNPKALWFSLSDDGNTLLVRADEPLVIENKALGYLVRYTLEEFTCNFRSQYVSHYGYALFEEMTSKNARQLQKWEANRRKAYWGSPQHFLKALVDRQAAAEGYTLYRLIRDPKQEASDRPDEGPTGAVPPDRSRDTTLRKMPVGAFDKYVQYLVNKPLSESAVLSQTGGQHRLRFGDYLYVIFHKEYEEPRFLPANQWKVPQTSILWLADESAVVDPSGSLPDPLSVVFEGRWGREKMGELLPLDYQPWEGR